MSPYVRLTSVNLVHAPHICNVVVGSIPDSIVDGAPSVDSIDVLLVCLFA